MYNDLAVNAQAHIPRGDVRPVLLMRLLDLGEERHQHIIEE